MSLKTTIQSAGIRAPATEKRKTNIEFIRSLDREHLGFRKKEKLIHITTTPAVEKIFIQFPGKETVSGRIWDFRPKILLPVSEPERPEDELIVQDSGEKLIFYKDRSFLHIWGIIFDFLRQYSEPEKEKIARLLAILLYRMAFLIDTEITAASGEVHVRMIAHNAEGDLSSITEDEEVLAPWYKYSPPEEAVEMLNSFSCRTIGGLSLEAFLQYNEILAWNEDCKYFFRNAQRAEAAEGLKWLNKTGRINTLLSHISVIGFALGEIELSNLLMKFVRGRGVGPATNAEIRIICREFIQDGT